MKRPTILGLAVLVLAMPAILALPEPALAEPVSKTGRITTTMVRSGVDHKVADAGGFKIAVDQNGVEYVVGTPLGVDNTVPGDCGESWLDWTEIDYWNHKAKFWTGFEIRSDWPGAITVDWNVVVIDDYGVSNKPKSTGFLRPNQVWGFTHWFTASGPTDIYAEVTFGMTVLANGTICFSHHPFDWTTVG